jgi:hypothetical protein
MKACCLKTPVNPPGQRKALTVILDGVVLPNRFPCCRKAYAGYGDWLRADTDRRWSGTVVPDKQEAEPTSVCVCDSLFLKDYVPQERRLTGHFYGWPFCQSALF